jgi:predicted  nucleic acid-binding Zn-ribbon protein
MRNIHKAGSKVQKYITTSRRDFAALQIGVEEVIAFKIALNQAAKYYNLPFVSATMRLIDDIKKYNKINDLKKELKTLYLQKYTLSEACSSHNQALITLAKLQSRAITEERILQLNNFLDEIGKDTKSIS